MQKGQLLQLYIQTCAVSRDVSKISSCQVNTTGRRGIKQLGISFSVMFLLFSYESSQVKSPAPTS